MLNVVVEVVKGGLIKALTGRLAAREVNQEELLDSLCKRLSEKFFSNEEIFSVLVEWTQHKAELVVIRSVHRAQERIKKVAEEKFHKPGGF